MLRSTREEKGRARPACKTGEERGKGEPSARGGEERKKKRNGKRKWEKKKKKRKNRKRNRRAPAEFAAAAETRSATRKVACACGRGYRKKVGGRETVVLN